MAEEPIPTGRNQWLWLLLFASMAALIIIWLVNTWIVESDVKPGASPGGLTFPAKPGYEVQAPTNGGAGAPEAPAPEQAAPER